MNRRILVAFTAIAGGLLGQLRAEAGGGPLNVFVVVNPNSPESMRIANEYVAMRQIPSGNVFYLPWNPTAPEVKGANFRDRILMPILKELDARKLGGQIDAIAYSSNFPFRINFNDIHPSPPEKRIDSPFASLTGATYLYPFVLANRRELTSLASNLYFQEPQGGVTQSRAFHGHETWEPGAKPGPQGMRYLLATAIAADVRGQRDADDAIRYLRRAAEADGSKPSGTFFFMDSSPDPRTMARISQFAPAIAELKALGKNAVVNKGRVPRGQREVLGITTGGPQIPLAGANDTLLPGALVDNLTSLGCNFTAKRHEKSQTLAPTYLKLGAAGASGTITEPFAVWQKFPAATLHVHYARGCSLAESFYQAISGPFQLLVLGDPLCQPWATFGKVDAHVEGGILASFSGIAEIKPTVAYPDNHQPARFELFIDGRRSAVAEPGQPLKFDTTKLADGRHRFDVVAVDAPPIETQSRWTDWIAVTNGHEALQLSELQSTNADEVLIQATCTREAEIQLLHNGREVGKVSGTTGKIAIPKSKLGAGPVLIEAVATGEPPLAARPLKLTIAPETH